jgi:hypothetical protein
VYVDGVVLAGTTVVEPEITTVEEAGAVGGGGIGLELVTEPDMDFDEVEVTGAAPQPDSPG